MIQRMPEEHENKVRFLDVPHISLQSIIGLMHPVCTRDNWVRLLVEALRYSLVNKTSPYEGEDIGLNPIILSTPVV